MIIENTYTINAVYIDNIFQDGVTTETQVGGSVFVDNYYSSGGGLTGVYVGTNPPADPFINQIWIQI